MKKIYHAIIALISRKRWLKPVLCTLMIGSSSLGYSQQLAKELFVNMPDSILPLLTAVNRADCIDFLESNMNAKVENRLNKTSEMTVLGNDYIQMQITPNSSWQMKTLAVNDSTQVICAISTACAPVCDSDIRFYDASWKQLSNTSYLTIPTLNDFLIEPTDSAALSDYQEQLALIDMKLVKADFEKENSQLVFTFTTPEYIGKESAEKLEQYIRPQLTYNWVEGKFVPVAHP